MRRPVIMPNSAIGAKWGACNFNDANNFVHSFLVSHLIRPADTGGRLSLGSTPEARQIADSVLTILLRLACPFSDRIASQRPLSISCNGVPSPMLSRKKRIVAVSVRPLGLTLSHTIQASANVTVRSPSFSARHDFAAKVSAYSCAAFRSLVPVESRVRLPPCVTEKYQLSDLACL